MKHPIAILCDFFRREVPRLEETYNWKIPKVVGFNQSGETGYQPNLNLKAFLTQLWERSLSREERIHLAKIIVSDWGGVRANRPDTLASYIDGITNGTAPTALNGVASYSKILAIVFPGKYAIYDARVAACLNAIQINAGIQNGIAFNYVPGRNNVIGNAKTKSGFTHEMRFSTKELVRAGWLPINRAQTYSEYLELLSNCSKELPTHKLASLEMALFANAESECIRAMRNTG